MKAKKIRTDFIISNIEKIIKSKTNVDKKTINPKINHIKIIGCNLIF